MLKSGILHSTQEQGKEFVASEDLKSPQRPLRAQVPACSSALGWNTGTGAHTAPSADSCISTLQSARVSLQHNAASSVLIKPKKTVQDPSSAAETQLLNDAAAM